MDSPALFLAFGAVMLVVALLAVAVDWFGKPMRHRRFVPKIYRFPDERQPRHSQVRRTDWSDASLVLPVVDRPDARLVRYPDVSAPGAGLPTSTPYLEPGPPTAQVPVVDPEVEDLLSVEPEDAPPSAIGGLVTLEDLEGADAAIVETEPVVDRAKDETEPETDGADGETEPETGGAQDETEPETDGAEDETGGDADDAGTDDEAERRVGWATGQYVLNLTPDGRDPSTTTVRTRYWKNVAATPGAAIFGDDNMARMRAGKAPQRLNHRTGKQETMRLPSSGWDSDDGDTPVPAWPAAEVDPFA